jgi:hypothetical protein
MSPLRRLHKFHQIAKIPILILPQQSLLLPLGRTGLQLL